MILLMRMQSAVLTPMRLSSTRLVSQSFKGRGGGGTTFKRINEVKRRSLKEILLQPTSGAPFSIGKGAIAGASLFGLGSLCYYGLGLSKEAGAFERSMVWPEYVKERIHSTYGYFGGSLALSAATAAAVLRNPTLMNMVTKNSLVALLVSVGAMIGSGMLVRSIPYKEGFGTKQMAWMLHASVIGTVLAPVALLGGPIVLRAALYTAGIVSGLSAVAVCAPSEKFLNMGGPLAIGLGVVFVSSLGTFFLPPTTALGAGIYSIALYGGLIVFSGFLLYDTQRIIRKAETHPYYAVQPYDPINSSISIYLDTVNIFIRMVMILSGGGVKKR